MNKKILIEQLQAHLLEELEAIAGKAGAGNTGAGNTGAGENGAMTPELGERVREIELQLNTYRFLPATHFGPGDVACASALVELELGGTRAYYFIGPRGGGLVTSVDGQPVQVITPNSPIGEAVLGKKAGELVEVQTRGGRRRYRIVSIS